MITNSRGFEDSTRYESAPWTSIILPINEYYRDRDLLTEILARAEPDIIIMNEPEHLLFTVSAVAESLDIPVVFETFDVTDTSALSTAVKDVVGEELEFDDCAYENSTVVKLASDFADGVLCLSDQTYKKLIRMGVARTKICKVSSLVPRLIKYGRSNVESKSLFFIGNMYYLPNELAARSLVQKIYPPIKIAHPEVHLTVVGDGPEPLLEWLRELGVDCPGAVDDLSLFLSKATLCVCPLQAGNDVKIKLLLCLSNGIPCVTTNIGASGLESLGGVLIEDDITRYPALIGSLLVDESQLLTLSKRAESMTDEFYNPAHQINQLVNFLKKTVAVAAVKDNPRKIGGVRMLKSMENEWLMRESRPIWLREEERSGRYVNASKQGDFRIIEGSVPCNWDIDFRPKLS